jgi:RNA polymerase sigma-70 factor (ECF subfamily)
LVLYARQAGLDLQQEQAQGNSWVQRIADGDSAAESELVEKYSRGVRLLLLKRTGNAQVAADCANDTFVVVLQKLRAGELNNPDALSAYIRQTAINLSIQYFRKEKRYVSQDDGIIELNLSHRDGKDSEIDRELLRGKLEEALEQLSVPRDREILRRFYLGDEDKDDICGALELSAAHFDRVLYRAKQRMRELINNQAELKSLLLGGLLDG